MSVFEIVVEPNVRRRRSRQPLSAGKRAAALFRIWHGMRDMIAQAERLGDSELVHFLEVARLLVEEKVASLAAGTGAASFEGIDTSRPN